MMASNREAQNFEIRTIFVKGGIQRLEELGIFLIESKDQAVVDIRYRFFSATSLRTKRK